MAEEKQFEGKIKHLLGENNAWYVKYWAGAKFTRAGVPDILCCINSTFLAVEVKATKGRPSELQKYNINEIRKAGGIAIILYPKDWEKFKKLVSMLYSGLYGVAKDFQYEFDKS